MLIFQRFSLFSAHFGPFLPIFAFLVTNYRLCWGCFWSYNIYVNDNSRRKVPTGRYFSNPFSTKETSISSYVRKKMIICRLLSKKWTSYLRLAFSVQPFPIGWKFQPKNENFRFVMKENVKFSNFEITPEIRELDPPILLWKLEFQLFLITYSNIIIMFLFGILRKFCLK